MLEGQSLKSLYPTEVKNIFTKSCINKHQQFGKTLEENYIRIDTPWILWCQCIGILLIF